MDWGFRVSGCRVREDEREAREAGTRKGRWKTDGDDEGKEGRDGGNLNPNTKSNRGEAISARSSYVVKAMTQLLALSLSLLGSWLSREIRFSSLVQRA